jgi:hypothetical protein
MYVKSWLRAWAFWMSRERDDPERLCALAADVLPHRPATTRATRVGRYGTRRHRDADISCGSLNVRKRARGRAYSPPINI